MRKLLLITALFSFLLLLIMCLFTSFINYEKLVTSPDELSNKIILKEYASKGNMYLGGEFLDKDLGNNLHPRGLITLNNKLVPINYLGFPLFFGPFYNLFLEFTPLIFKLIFVLLFSLIMIKIFNIVYPKNKRYYYLLFSLILCTPLIFYLNFFYYNIIPSLIFLIFFIYYLINFNKNNKFIYCLLFTLFGFISIFFRYENVLFISLTIFINILNNSQLYYKNIIKSKNIIYLFLISLLSFFIPLLISNYKIYGNPLTYGYSLFNKVYFFNERANSLFSIILNILLPGGYIELNVFYKNILYGLFLISPVVIILGFYSIFKERRKYLLFYFIPLLFLLFYTGMNPNSYLSGTEVLSFNKSIIRYWLIIPLLMTLPFSYYLKDNKFRYFKILLIFSLLLLSIISLFSIRIETNLQSYQKTFQELKINQEKIGEILSREDYLITSTNDKNYYELVNIISWWGGPTEQESDIFFNETNIANLTKLFLSKNKKVYFLADKANSEYINLLEKEGLKFDQIIEFQGLYKISLKNQTLT